MLYAGLCRVCETGPLGLRACGTCQQIVLLCDECDAAWTDAGTDQPPRFLSDPSLPCPHCEDSLAKAPSRWATLDECQACGWIAEALDAGTIDLSRGEPMK